MPISSTIRAALAGGLVLFLCTGCGDQGNQTSASPLGVQSGAGQFARGPGSSVTSPASPLGLPSVDHGAPQRFWPQPQWSPDRLAREERQAYAAESRTSGGTGLFGLPGGGSSGSSAGGSASSRVPPPDRNPVRSEQEAAADDAGTSRGTLLKSGTASWYGPGFHGRKTANGEIYDQNKMTAAMTGVPLGIRVRVERTDTGSSIEVRVNDRGPYERKNGKWVPHRSRVIDLSKKAMQALGGISAGVIPVKVYRIE